MDHQTQPRPGSSRGDSTSSRLPWRHAEIGRRRLAGMAASRSANAKGGKGARNGVDIDDHIRFAVREESAATLGRAGRKLQEAVAALAEFDRGGRRPLPVARRPLLHEAAVALWECVVQREAIGLTNHDLLGQLYGVTPELWRLMGTAETTGAG